MRTKTSTAGRRGVGFALPSLLAIAALLLLAAPAAAADRTVRLTLDPSASACTAFDQLDCSYLEARNGNKPAPDPNDPNAVAPTFLNLAQLDGPVIVDGVIHDDGTFTVADGDVSFPTFDTTLSNALVGDVAVGIDIKQTGDWTGTFDDVSGAVSLTAPLGLTFKLNCDPVANGLCGLIFGTEGNMGTWQVDAKGPVDPLTTGNLPALVPPVPYGPDWVPTDVEDGVPYGAGTKSLTLINNNLELKHLEPSSCIDPTSTACTNVAIGGLILPPLNDALGASYVAPPGTSLDTVPGAIDMRLAFKLSEPPILTDDTDALDFGQQTVGSASGAKPVTITAYGIGDVQVVDLYSKGGDDADFWVANNNCHGLIAADGSCTLKVKFQPGEAGARASTLYAMVVDPISHERQEVELASLSGEGVAATRGIRPVIEPKLNARVSGSGSAVVAKVRCPEGDCTVVKRKASMRADHEAYKAEVSGSDTIAEGGKEKMSIVLSKRAIKALEGTKQATAKVKLRVASSNETATKQTFRLRLRLKK